MSKKVLVNVDLNQNQVMNAVLQPLATAPANAKLGQIYYNSTDKMLYQYNGTAWVAVGKTVSYDLELDAVSSNVVPIKLVNPEDEEDVSTVYIKGAGGATITRSGATMTITTANDNTTYTFSGQMNTTDKTYDITITPSTGSATTIHVPADYVTEDMLDDYVPTTRKVNGKALSSDVTLGSGDIARAGGATVEASLSSLETNKADKSDVEEAVDALDAKIDQEIEDREAAVATKVDKVEGKGLSENDYTDEDKALVDGALQTSGGTMSGNIAMGGNKITGLANGTADADAVNYKQLSDAIAGLGTVFNLKGQKATVANLPTSGNKVGDVWYVKEKSAGYIWITVDGTNKWEELGETVDLSGYLQIANLATATGQNTNTAMTQKAVTDALGGKVDKTQKVNGNALSGDITIDAEDVPYDSNNSVKDEIDALKEKSGVGVETATLPVGDTNKAVAVSGTVINVVVKDSNGDIVITDVRLTATGVTVSIAEAYTSALTIIVTYVA